MNKEKKNGKRLAVLMAILAFILFVGGGAIFYLIDKNHKEEVIVKDNVFKEELLKQNEAVFKEYNADIEYGSKWTLEDFYSNLLEESKIVPTTNKAIKVEERKIESDYTFDKVGNLEVSILLVVDIEYPSGQSGRVEVEKVIPLTIKDTVYPIIEGVKDRTITVGDKIDLKSGIRAYDAVDGELEITVLGDVDTSKRGTYEVRVRAEDKNSNAKEEAFKVTVKERTKPSTSTPKPTVPTNPTTPSVPTAPSEPDASTAKGRLELAKIEAKKVASQIIKPGMSDEEKAKAIFNYLHYNVSLQWNQSTEAYKTNFGNEAYAALILKIAACSGFCKAVTLLCNEAGLQSQHVNQNQWKHQWNRVLIDGKWIVLDAQGGIFGGERHPLE